MRVTGLNALRVKSSNSVCVCVCVCVCDTGHKRANLFLMNMLFRAIAGKLIRSHAL